jgi:predicted transposase/invertase (TIGR01784 family)
MSYDSTCKFIAETFSADIASWLLGQAIALTKLEPSELAVEPIRADSLIFLQSEDLILHCEFQTAADPTIPFRMADYRLRAYRRFPGKKMHQVVVYLRQTESPAVTQTRFELENTVHQFNVIRLWEQLTEPFLTRSGLLPFAVLTQTSNQAQVLQQVANRIEILADVNQRRNLAAASGLLAGLILNKTIIRQLLREELMRESVIFQELEAEAMQKGWLRGHDQGLQEGLQQEGKMIVIRQLTRRLGNVPAEAIAKISALTLAELEALSEALLDFTQPEDLTHWLQHHS